MDGFLTETETLNYEGVTDRYEYEILDPDAWVRRLQELLADLWRVEPDDELADALALADLSLDDYRSLGRAMGATDPMTDTQIADARSKERGALSELQFAEVVKDFHHATAVVAPNLDHPVSILHSEIGRDILAFMTQDDDCTRCEGTDRLMVVSVKSSAGLLSPAIIRAADEELCDEEFPLRVRQQLHYLLDSSPQELRGSVKVVMAQALKLQDHPSVVRTIAVMTGATPEVRIARAVRHLRRDGLKIARVLTCDLDDFADVAEGVFAAFREGDDD